ncbi:MAG TPA: tetratricopeptide repeat protein [Bacteroidales bacterium]|nr:tetratricopeptide repeat protein [Bacteroidales bacterium]
MMRQLVAITLFLLIPFSAFSQNNDEEARQYYQRANEAFKAGNFTECISSLYKVEDLQGRSDIRVLPLLIKSYYAIEAWRFVINDFQRYMELKGDTNLIEFVEIKELEFKARQKVEQESTEFKNLVENGTIEAYEKYLAKYPYGSYRDEVTWLRAEKLNSFDSYLSYLEIYPMGKHYIEATGRGVDIDKNAYNKALSEGTMFSLDFYLANFPKGGFRAEIMKKIEELKEDALYSEVLSTRDYENYTDRYPNGKYTLEIHELNKNLLLGQGAVYFSLGDFDASIQRYKMFIEKYPFDSRVWEVQEMMTKCLKRKKRAGAETLTFIIDTEKSLTIGYENFRLHKIGGYIDFRVLPTFVTLLMYGDNTINNQGETNVDNITLKDVEKTGPVGVSGGITFKVIYPLWVAVGAGITYYPVFVKAYDSSLEENIWLKHTDKSSIAFVPQCNLNLKISKGFVLKAGILYHNGVKGQFGLGFKI